jgi:hypothetical protein
MGMADADLADLRFRLIGGQQETLRYSARKTPSLPYPKKTMFPPFLYCHLICSSNPNRCFSGIDDDVLNSFNDADALHLLKASYC